MKHKYGNTLLALLVIGLVFLGGCSGSTKSESETPASVSIPEVTTSEAVLQDIPTYFEATGSLTGDMQTDIAPAIGGKIAEVNFEIGTFVKKGFVMVRLDDRDARIRLEQATQAAEQALASLRQSQVRLGLTDGQTFDIERFSQVRSTRAQLELAEKELARGAKLLESGDIPRSAYDQRKAQRDSLLAQLDEARANAAIAVKSIDIARGAYGNAKAQVAAAEKALSDMSITAPIDGYVSERNADVGEFISPNVPNSKIATLVKTKTLRMRIDVPEESIAKVSKGQAVTIQVSAYADREFAGRIARLSPSVNPTSRTMIVEAEIDNADALLKPGQFATVRVTQAKPAPAVMVPASAVRTDGTSSRIYVVKDGVISERLVQLGLLENELIEIKKGVEAGEKVVTGNISGLTDGMLVKEQN